MPSFLKENKKADNLSNMTKFINGEVTIQDERLDDLNDNFDTEFIIYEKS